jgi:oligopeptide/dipeptide ABC transporter ATP-binding protein
MSHTPLLRVRELSVALPDRHGQVPVLEGVSFDLRAGGGLGVVGESGSGKTTTLRALLQLLPHGAVITNGRATFDGADLLTVGGSQLRDIRGGKIGMIWQDPLAALDPLMRVGEQIAETAQAHAAVSWIDARRRARDLMRRVELPDVERTYRAYPHQLSGGQRQRVVIASAIAASPRLLLADEPTTALDVTVQDQVLSLIAKLRADLGLALLLVSHDLAVVDQTCEDVAVMYAGRIVETGPSRLVFERPLHHYTAGLLRAAPSLDRPGVRPRSIPGTPAVSVAARGCAFAPRCPAADLLCLEQTPVLAGAEVHQAACHHPLKVRARAKSGEEARRDTSPA